MIWLLPRSPNPTYYILNRTTSFHLQGASLSLGLETSPSALLCLEFLLLQSQMTLSIYVSCPVFSDRAPCPFLHTTYHNSYCLLVYCLFPYLQYKLHEGREPHSPSITSVWKNDWHIGNNLYWVNELIKEQITKSLHFLLDTIQMEPDGWKILSANL